MKKAVTTAIMTVAIVLGTLATIPPARAGMWGWSDRQGWDWPTSPVPLSNQIMMTPVVADLDADGSTPEIIFTTWIRGGAAGQGIVRIIDGATLAHINSFTAPRDRVYAFAQIAVANIDGDPQLEIIAITGDRQRVICWDGVTPFLRQPGWPQIGAVLTGADQCGQGGPAVANLDGMGDPEVIVGRTVFNSDGTVRWQATTGGTGGWSAISPLSVVADVDLDTEPEVVTGNTAWDPRGPPNFSWQDLNLPDGFPGIADFDLNGVPEVVVVTNGWVYLLDGQTGVSVSTDWPWDRSTITDDLGGPPTIMDWDGDGVPEIGVAGRNRYVILEARNPTNTLWVADVKWAFNILDGSSGICSASAFDFDRDGRDEIVYADETGLLIFKWDLGRGFPVYFDRRPSGTLCEMPVIADVDSDGCAEIVVGCNNYATHPSEYTGLRVYHNDPYWGFTRETWNQHTYHITNINKDGTVPSPERNNWDYWDYWGNNYRCQFSHLERAVGGTMILINSVPVSKLNSLMPWILLTAPTVAVAVSVIIYKRKHRASKTSYQMP